VLPEQTNLVADVEFGGRCRYQWGHTSITLAYAEGIRPGP
jgi:hypothetical protein